MSFKIYQGQEYDWSDKRIVCMADADGASVFPVDGPAGKKRVLSWSEEEAKDAYWEVMQEDPNFCRECARFGLNCVCDEIDALNDEIEDLKKPPTPKVGIQVSKSAPEGQ